jgi:hypothetical protein
MIQITAVQDDSCHWYVIPSVLASQFSKDSENEEMADSGEFDEKYGKYRTNGDLNNVQLWADIDPA